MTGIDAIDVAVPRYRVDADTYEEAAGSFRGRIDSKAVPGHDEDAVTMAVDAARNLGLGDSDGVDLLAVASTTRPQPGTLAAGPISRSLGLQGDRRTLALGASWKAGLEALDAALSAGDGLAIAADAPTGELGDDADHVLGAGAAAVRTGEGTIADLVGSAHYTDARLPETFEDDGDVVDLGIGAYGTEGLQNAVERVVEGALADADLDASDVAHAVLPQEDVKTGWRLGGRLGFEDGQRTAGWVVNRMGFAGAATPLVGLASALGDSEPGDRVLVTAYGHGEGASALCFEADEGVADVSIDVTERVAAATPVDVTRYLALRRGET